MCFRNSSFSFGIYFAALFQLFIFRASTGYPQKITDSSSFFYPSEKLNKKRVALIAGTEAVTYTAVMTGLYSLWYKNIPLSSFHLFDDSDEWLQMDKGGHVLPVYYTGKAGMEVLQWAGVSRGKSLWYGGMLGFAFMTTAEIFDGFSSGWGASLSDITFNGGGAAILLIQEQTWQEQRILLKFSYTPTEYAQYRPALLGKSPVERALKDYNGMNYWASVNIASFLKKGNKFPRWLNVALGYGADGMLGGKNNPLAGENGVPLPEYKRKRQYYLSLDVDLTRLVRKPSFAKTFFNTFGFIKFPAPTLEWSGNKLKLHPVYF